MPALPEKFELGLQGSLVVAMNDEHFSNLRTVTDAGVLVDILKAGKAEVLRQIEAGGEVSSYLK
ncbi:hypothetical protein KC799_11185 [candidate division KSB1 bacterium]|nr:hypothetical protein [candidate division KSB1 bacterium]